MFPFLVSDHGREYTIPALDDALHAICSSSAGQHHQVASTHPRNQYSPRSTDPSLRSAAGYYQNNGPCSAGRKRRPPENNGGHNDTYVIQTSPGAGATVSSLHARQLHNHSLRNLAASRSLFEQQLVQQQAMLVKQQQESLKMFDSAIQNEMERDYYHGGGVVTNGVIDGGGDCAMPTDHDATQCDSPTSVDSLEVPTTSAANGGKSDFSNDSLENHFFARQADVGRDVTIPTTDAPNAAFAEHSRSFSSPRSNVAVVMPCFVQHRDESVSDTAVKNNADKPFFHSCAEDSNNNNLDKGAVYGHGATVRRADPFSIANNGRRNEQYYQDLIVNRASTVDVIGNRNLPVNVNQTSDWKINNADNDCNQMDNVWARPLNSAEMTQTHYHTSSLPLSTIATIEGGNVVYSHNHAPKQASCIPPDNSTVSIPIATGGAVPKRDVITCSQMAPDVSEAAPIMIPGTNAVTTPAAVSYHCSQTVPGSFVTVSNVYSTQVQNDGMQQYGKTVSGPPMTHWQAVSANVPGANHRIHGSAGDVAMTLTQPTSATKSTLRFAPKGILKQRDEDPTVIPAPRNRFTPGGASMKHNGRNVHIRDSVEVIKEHQKTKVCHDQSGRF